jgi:hypothetical protein
VKLELRAITNNQRVRDNAVVISSTFATEFLHQQKTQPKYKGTLKRAFIIVLILAVVVATLNDVYHLLVA